MQPRGGAPAAAVLPPATRAAEEVLPYLADATTGLPDEVAGSEPYRARLGLDAVAQPYVSAGYSQFGGMYGGGIALAFSDMLGNHNLYAVIDASTHGGGFTDLHRNTGAILAYSNLTRRWNWGISGGRCRT